MIVVAGMKKPNDHAEPIKVAKKKSSLYTNTVHRLQLIKQVVRTEYLNNMTAICTLDHPSTFTIILNVLIYVYFIFIIVTGNTFHTYTNFKLCLQTTKIPSQL